MTTDARTANRDYPKPYPSNLIAEDVLRLATAIEAIDADVAAALASLVEKAPLTSLDEKAALAGATFTGEVDAGAGLAVTGRVIERVDVIAAAPAVLQEYPLSGRAVLLHTADAANDFTANFTGLSGLADGEAATFAVLVQNGATAYNMVGIEVDGATAGVTTRWQGGSAPSTGNANAIDAYSVTIIKTAASTYTVLAAQTQF